MSGRGPAPKPKSQRRFAGVPKRGEWSQVAGYGWQHGETPEVPFAVGSGAARAWEKWMKAWFASNWTDADLPGLFVTIALYDEFESYRINPTYETTDAKGKTVIVQKRDPSPTLRQYMDSFGITPKGQQDRRWQKPEPKLGEEQKPDDKATPYSHLKIAK